MINSVIIDHDYLDSKTRSQPQISYSSSTLEASKSCPDWLNRPKYQLPGNVKPCVNCCEETVVTSKRISLGRKLRIGECYAHMPGLGDMTVADALNIVFNTSYNAYDDREKFLCHSCQSFLSKMVGAYYCFTQAMKSKPESELGRAVTLVRERGAVERLFLAQNGTQTDAKYSEKEKEKKKSMTMSTRLKKSITNTHTTKAVWSFVHKEINAEMKKLDKAATVLRREFSEQFQTRDDLPAFYDALKNDFSKYAPKVMKILLLIGNRKRRTAYDFVNLSNADYKLPPMIGTASCILAYSRLRIQNTFQRLMYTTIHQMSPKKRSYFLRKLGITMAYRSPSLLNPIRSLPISVDASGENEVRRAETGANCVNGGDEENLPSVRLPISAHPRNRKKCPKTRATSSADKQRKRRSMYRASRPADESSSTDEDDASGMDVSESEGDEASPESPPTPVRRPTQKGKKKSQSKPVKISVFSSRKRFQAGQYQNSKRRKVSDDSSCASKSLPITIVTQSPEPEGRMDPELHTGEEMQVSFPGFNPIAVQVKVEPLEPFQLVQHPEFASIAVTESSGGGTELRASARPQAPSRRYRVEDFVKYSPRFSR